MRRAPAMQTIGVRPTFDQGPFAVCGKRNGDQVSLWTADREGGIGMTASAVPA